MFNEHQQTVIDEVCDNILQNNRIVYTAPAVAGSGKTTVAIEIMRKLVESGGLRSSSEKDGIFKSDVAALVFNTNAAKIFSDKGLCSLTYSSAGSRSIYDYNKSNPGIKSPFQKDQKFALYQLSRIIGVLLDDTVDRSNQGIALRKNVERAVDWCIRHSCFAEDEYVSGMYHSEYGSLFDDAVKASLFLLLNSFAIPANHKGRYGGFVGVGFNVQNAWYMIPHVVKHVRDKVNLDLLILDEAQDLSIQGLFTSMILSGVVPSILVQSWKKFWIDEYDAMMNSKLLKDNKGKLDFMLPWAHSLRNDALEAINYFDDVDCQPLEMSGDRIDDVINHVINNPHSINGNIASILAIGDPRQSINGWNGAIPRMFDRIHSIYESIGNDGWSEEVPVSYRIASCISDEVSRVLPGDFNTISAPGNPEGSISILASDEVISDVVELYKSGEGGNAAIIGRTNNSLLPFVFRLVRSNIYVNFKGNNISDLIAKEIEYAAKNTLISQMARPEGVGNGGKYKFYTQQQIAAVGVTEIIDYLKSKYQRIKGSRAKNRDIELDKIDMVINVLHEHTTLTEVYDTIAQIEEMSKPHRGAVTLTVAHRTKGDEYDTVFIISDSFPSPYAETESELHEELCIQYVTITRAKERVVYIDYSW